jgi:hypothetical protein
MCDNPARKRGGDGRLLPDLIQSIGIGVRTPGAATGPSAARISPFDIGQPVMFDIGFSAKSCASERSIVSQAPDATTTRIVEIGRLEACAHRAGRRPG